jgi:UDP-galactopyranose mutase
MAYDLVIVGAGLFGSTLARSMTDRGRKVLVLDEKPHIAGMCHTARESGVLVHTYGPHVFHTNDNEIWGWLNRFSDFYPFIVRTKAISAGRLYTLPFNLMTFHQMWGVTTPSEARRKLDQVRIPIENPETIEEFALSSLGPEIYEKFVLPYSLKQWGRYPKDLPASILKRLPVRTSLDDNYFTDKYQGLPVGGYTQMFERILDGIEVRLNTDFFSDRKAFEGLGRIVYSGRVDKFFEYRYGDLEFRSCRFENRTVDGDHQGNPVIHWVDADVPWTRVIEHKHFENPANQSSVITKELPFECDRKSMPLYPINDRKNMELYAKYRAIQTSAIFGGRLGSYRYRDMHHVIAEALRLSERLN